MTTFIPSQKTAGTVGRFIRVMPSSDTLQFYNKRPFTRGTAVVSASERMYVPITEAQHLNVEDSREATDEEVQAAYRKIKPSIEGVIRLLANS